MKELSVVGLSGKIRDYSGASPKVQDYELRYILEDGGILLTTYDIVRNNFKSIRGDHYVYDDGSEEDILWDYTVLDEGHIIKNPKTQRAQSLFEIPSAHRIIISGTPIQNNLKELWALFYFCSPAVLGDKEEFKVKYESKILRGNDKHASDREKHVGSTVAKELRERIKPYFLRRLKSEVFGDNDATSVKLSKKNEIIVWLKLTICQRQLYEAFLKSEWVYSSIDGGSPLAALTVFKGGLFRTATEQKEQMRYFSQKDIRDVFSLPKHGFDISLTQQQLLEEDGQQHDMDASLKCHIEFLERQGIAGVSHHSLLFSKTATVPLVPENNEVQSKVGNKIVRSFHQVHQMKLLSMGRTMLSTQKSSLQEHILLQFQQLKKKTVPNKLKIELDVSPILWRIRHWFPDYLIRVVRYRSR